MICLHFMSNPTMPEFFRGRVYGASDEEDRRVAFLEALAGQGVIDCPAYDGWVAALQKRGWLPNAPELEANPDGEGKVGRWRLTERGRAEWKAVRS